MAQPFKGADLPEYTPSKCIEGLTNVLPSSILNEINSLLEILSVLQKRLELCLSNQKAGGVSFTQYKNELSSPRPDYRLINKWEHHQRSSLSGTIQGEVYRYVIDMQQEFEGFHDSLNKFIYKSKASLPIDKKVDEDKLFVDNMAQKDMRGALEPLDIDIIKVKTQVNHCALRQVLNAQEYVRGLTGLCTYTLNDKYNGNIEPVVRGFADTSLDNLKSFNPLNKIGFNKKAAKSENDRLHAENMLSAPIKAGMNEMMFNISDAVVNARQPLLSWAGSLDSDDDNGPMTPLIEEVIGQLEFLDTEHSYIIESMFGMNRLDAISKQDHLQTMREKKSSRMLVNLVDDMIQERERGVFDINKFISKHKILEPGNMCTN
jgi:hypothetical protein